MVIDVDDLNLLPELKEYLPGPKEEVKTFSKEQVDLVNKLVKINVSNVTAENLIRSNDQVLIEKWIGAINYSNAGDKAACLVKAIRENWQFPEEYLRVEKDKLQREEQKNTSSIRDKRKRKAKGGLKR